MILSSRYAAEFDRLLASVGEWQPRHSKRGPPTLTMGWPTCGDRYQPGRGLLVIGRALNGFSTPQFNREDAQCSQHRRRFIEEAINQAAGGGNERPLEWLWTCRHRNGGTYGSRSAFWRMTRECLRELSAEAAEPDDWASNVAWTNIAKVAPQQGGNPSTTLYEAQKPHLGRLLKAEVAELNPAHVLVLAGGWWSEQFREVIGLPPQAYQVAESVCRAERGAGRCWLVAERPERKKESTFHADVKRALADCAATERLYSSPEPVGCG